MYRVPQPPQRRIVQIQTLPPKPLQRSKNEELKLKSLSVVGRKKHFRRGKNARKVTTDTTSPNSARSLFFHSEPIASADISVSSSIAVPSSCNVPQATYNAAIMRALDQQKSLPRRKPKLAPLMLPVVHDHVTVEPDTPPPPEPITPPFPKSPRTPPYEVAQWHFKDRGQSPWLDSFFVLLCLRSPMHSGGEFGRFVYLACIMQKTGGLAQISVWHTLLAHSTCRDGGCCTNHLSQNLHANWCILHKSTLTET